MSEERVCPHCGEPLRETAKTFICYEHGQQVWKRTCVVCQKPFISVGSFAAKYCSDECRKRGEWRRRQMRRR